MDALRHFLIFVSMACLLGLASACTDVSPAVRAGALTGAPCASDLECASGLACECGICDVVGDIDDPARCDLDLADLCGEEDIPCYVVCGDLFELGVADCSSGVPLCSEGVVRESCPADICWGPAALGEVCVEGEYECLLGRSLSGECYTDDCVGDLDCVGDCELGEPIPAQCVASELQCEVGIPRSECGACFGTPPLCFADCTSLSPLADSRCQNDDFTCSFLAGASVESECFCTSPSIVITGAADLALLSDTSCHYEQIIIRSDDDSLTLPGVISVQDLQVASGLVRVLSLPDLETVTQTLTVSNLTNLQNLVVPNLTQVRRSLVIEDNPNLAQCIVNDIVANLSNVGTVRTQNNQAECTGSDGGPQNDVTPADANNLPDAGTPDAGSFADAAARDGNE